MGAEDERGFCSTGGFSSRLIYCRLQSSSALVQCIIPPTWTQSQFSGPSRCSPPFFPSRVRVPLLRVSCLLHGTGAREQVFARAAQHPAQHPSSVGEKKKGEMADSAGLRRTRPTEKKRAASVDLPDLQPDLQPDDARQHTSGTPPLAPRPVAELSAAAPATASAEPLSNDTVTPAVGGPGWRTPAGFQAAIQRAVTAAMAPVETKLADMAKLLDQLAAENASLKRDLAASSETQQRALMAEQAEGHRLADRLDELQRSQRSAERTQRSANLVVHCLPETDGVSPEAAFRLRSAEPAQTRGCQRPPSSQPPAWAASARLAASPDPCWSSSPQRRPSTSSSGAARPSASSGCSWTTTCPWQSRPAGAARCRTSWLSSEQASSRTGAWTASCTTRVAGPASTCQGSRSQQQQGRAQPSPEDFAAPTPAAGPGVAAPPRGRAA